MTDHFPEVEAGVVRLVSELLQRALRDRASDVHFEPTSKPLRVRFRIDGMLHDVDELPEALAENVIARLKVLGGLLTYRVDIPQEGSFRITLPDAGETRGYDARVATFPTIHGERAVVRLLPADDFAADLDVLGFAPDVVRRLRALVTRPSGLLLVTGPAGSGKSTTLYALARVMSDAAPGRCIISLEDPVEQGVSGMTQIQIQPHGALDYVRAMRSLLRQDVQVLLVGEIRDAATAHVVVEAALTGHLVLSTMHSGDPAECIARLLEMGIAPYQLVGALTAVCAQRLLRCACSMCAGAGCARCAGTGYWGRTACACLVEMDADVHAAVLRSAPAAELRALIALRFGELGAEALRLLEAGITTRDEIARVLGMVVRAGERPIKAFARGRSPCLGMTTMP